MILNEHNVSFAENGVVNENKLKKFKTILTKGSGKLNRDAIICRE